MSRGRREAAQAGGPWQLLLLGPRPLAAAVPWSTNTFLAQLDMENRAHHQKKEKCRSGRETIPLIRMYTQLLRTILRRFSHKSREMDGFPFSP